MKPVCYSFARGSTKGKWFAVTIFRKHVVRIQACIIVLCKSMSFQYGVEEVSLGHVSVR